MTRELNVICVARIPTMSYVLAMMTGFTGSSAEEVTLKGRGQAITTAVNAAEIVGHRFVEEANVREITIGTEEMPPREGESRTRNVSPIEITLSRETKPKE